MDYNIEITEMKKSITTLQTDVAEIKTTQSFLKELLERNTKSNEKLADTLDNVEKSMISINDNLKLQSNEIGGLRKDLDETTDNFEKKISSVENRVKNIDEEGKFNIREFLKNYFPWIVVLIGIGVNILSKYIKF